MTTLLVIGATAVASAQQQVPLGDTQAVLRATVAYARQHQLKESGRYALAVEQGYGRTAWDRGSLDLLARELSSDSRNPLPTKACRAAPTECQPTPAYELVTVFPVTLHGDTAFVEVAVHRATNSASHPFVIRSRSYVLHKTGGSWAVAGDEGMISTMH